jgi:imidazolonepropionase-like amidohydrolase
MIVIKGGNLHLNTGEVKKADILIEGANIKKIGKDIDTGSAQSIDAAGKEVFAGFIEPCTGLGLRDYTNLMQLDNNEISDPCAPHLNVKYSLDLREILRQQYHYTGITSFGASPGANNVISGQMGVYHTAGTSIKEMCLKEFAAVKGDFTMDVKRTYGMRGLPPMTKMSMAWMLKDALRAAKDYIESGEAPYNPKNESLAKVLKGEVPLFVNAASATEIKSVIEITAEFDLPLVLSGVYQVKECVDEIIEKKIPVVLGQPHIMGFPAPYGTDYTAVSDLLAEGIPVGLTSGGDSVLGGREVLLWSAFKLRQEGFASSDVEKMISYNNAVILGVEGLTGALEEGKLADIVVYDGHPLETFESRVAWQFVAGTVVHEGNGGFEKCSL